MFKKLVAIEPVSLVEEAEKELHQYAEEVVMYDGVPTIWVPTCVRKST